MRLGILMAVVFAAGIAMGWFVSPSESTNSESVDVVSEDSDADSAELERLQAEVEWLRGDRDAAEAEILELTGRLTASAETLRLAEQAIADLDIIEDSIAEAAVQPEELQTKDDEDAARKARRERMQEMWQGRGQEIQNRMRTAMDERLAAIEDPAQVESMNALLEWRAYQQEMRRELGETESEEDRIAILTEMEAARSASRQILQSQQDTLLRDLAEHSGIRGNAAQDDFVGAVRDTLENPFFELEGMLTGGGPRGFGGPRTRGGRVRR